MDSSLDRHESLCTVGNHDLHCVRYSYIRPTRSDRVSKARKAGTAGIGIPVMGRGPTRRTEKGVKMNGKEGKAF